MSHRAHRLEDASDVCGDHRRHRVFRGRLARRVSHCKNSSRGESMMTACVLIQQPLTPPLRLRPRGGPLGCRYFLRNTPSTRYQLVYDALLAGKRFTANFRSCAATCVPVKSYEVNPLGLVGRGDLLYLERPVGVPSHPTSRPLSRRACIPTDNAVAKPNSFSMSIAILSWTISNIPEVS